MAHAGWMGTLRDVPSAAVNAMKTNYGCNAADILAYIGPSIGPDHYEIGAEVRDAFTGKDEGTASAFVPLSRARIWTSPSDVPTRSFTRSRPA